MPRKKDYLPIGKEPKYNLYHDWYDRLRLGSKILNADANKPSINMILWTKDSIQNELFNIVGDEEGFVLRDNKKMPAMIPFVTKQLEDIEVRYESYIRIQLRQGKPKPKELPSELLKERLKLEAKLSILQEEASELEKQLKPYLLKEEEKLDRKVLSDGPIGVGRLRGGQLIEIDGMHVSINEDETPFINDERAGKYDGYLTCDYYQYAVKPFLQAKETQRALNIQQARKDQVPMDRMTKSKRNGITKYPDMPEDCANFKLKVKEEI